MLDNYARLRTPPLSRIADHALIGDCRSAALVDGHGAIDWLCWPRFDSDPIFASLLDPARGGLFRIAAAVASASSSCDYVEGTNVARTTFSTHDSKVELFDLMTVDFDAAHDRTIAAEHEIVRVAHCTEGAMTLRVELDPRPGFGASRTSKAKAHLHVDRHGVVQFRDHAALYTLRSTATPTQTREEWHVGERGSGLECTISLRAGQRVTFVLSYARDRPTVLGPLDDAWVDETVARTVAVWRAWSKRARYEGPYRDAVVRSALVLKLLCYSPSGAIIAAPTTSLPEVRGGAHNWDYRFCWLRDAAFTTRAFYGLGYRAEGDAFVDWLGHATRLTRPALQVLYDVFGKQPMRERVIPELAGFDGASPVRVGNAAKEQVQLDVYGEVIDAIAQCAYVGMREGGTHAHARLDSALAKIVRELGTYVVDHWRERDEGIWEPREARRHHVHSGALCWVALDRILQLERCGAIEPLDADLRSTFEQNRDAIAREVRLQGWDEHRDTYLATYADWEHADADANTNTSTNTNASTSPPAVDASLLLLGWYGFEDPASHRMRATAAAIDRELGVGRGLLRRNLEVAEDGGFVATSFWAVEQLARAGLLEEARARFESLVALASPSGLFGEIVAVSNSGNGAGAGAGIEHLGNYPQGFSHLALINAALSIEQVAAERRRGLKASQSQGQAQQAQSQRRSATP